MKWGKIQVSEIPNVSLLIVVVLMSAAHVKLSCDLANTVDREISR